MFSKQYSVDTAEGFGYHFDYDNRGIADRAEKDPAEVVQITIKAAPTQQPAATPKPTQAPTQAPSAAPSAAAASASATTTPRPQASGSAASDASGTTDAPADAAAQTGESAQPELISAQDDAETLADEEDAFWGEDGGEVKNRSRTAVYLRWRSC